jgi:SEL1 protein
LKKWYEATPDDYSDPDDIYGTATSAGDDELDAHVAGDEYYDVEFDDDLVESVIILVLATAVAILVYYRQQRQQNMARRQQQRQREQAAAGAPAGVGVGVGVGVGGVGVGLQGPLGPDFAAPWGIPH